MAVNERVTIQGLSSVRLELNRLGSVPESRAVREVFFEAGAVYQRTTRSILPLVYKRPDKVRGRLERGLLRRMPKRVRNGRRSLVIGFRYVNGRSSEAEKAQAANHAHLLDKGTAERWTKKGLYRGKVTATYFWTSAKRASRDRAVTIIEQGLLRALRG